MNKEELLNALGSIESDLAPDHRRPDDAWKAVHALQDKLRVNGLFTGDVEIDKMLQSCVDTLSTKGREYTVGSTDRLANFRGVSEAVGIPMEKAWYVFFNKHLTALQSYIKNGCKVQSNETIHGRIMDLITYLLLFEKMTREIESRQNGK